MAESSKNLVRNIEVENNCEVSLHNEGEKRKINNEQMEKGEEEIE